MYSGRGAGSEERPLSARTVIPEGVIRTLCRQCDMRCGVRVHVRRGRIVKLSGDPQHPVSRGRVCAKATAAAETAYHPERLFRALRRGPEGVFVPLEAGLALEEIAERIERIRRADGARAVGVWTGEAIGFFQQEEYARRFVHALGSPNYFSAESVCFASRYMAYCLHQGYYSPCPDFEHAALILLWGSNLGVTHPPFMHAVEAGRRNGAKLVVIDPRRTEAAREADTFLQIRPGTDGALALGLAGRLIETGSHDREFVARHSIGFERFAAYARTFTLQEVARETGLDPEAVVQVGRLLARAGGRVANYAGISLEHQPHGLATIRTIAALNGVCGAVDRRGGEPWPEAAPVRHLTLYEERPLEDQAPIGADRFPALYAFRKQCHSLSAMDAILGRGSYRLRGLIITGANPVLTNPHSAKVKQALRGLDLLVVHDLFMTATARLAHYVLPAAGFLERSEIHYYPRHQVMGLSQKVLEVPGVMDEYTFWRGLARCLGFGESVFPWEDEAEVNRWILSPAGLTTEQLAGRPEGVCYAPPRTRKFEQRPFPTSSGKFEFVSETLAGLGYDPLPRYTPPAVPAQGDPYPFVLITGARHPLYYHSRNRNIGRFRRRHPEAAAEIHPADAARLGIRDGERIRMVSAVGQIRVRARVVAPGDIPAGVLQVGHGWEDPNINLLTSDEDLDPVSGYPNMKQVPVRIEKMTPHRGSALDPGKK